MNLFAFWNRPPSLAVLLGGAAALMLTACSGASIGQASRSALDTLAPYKVEVVQGNFVSSEQVALLQRGMSRQQVREILGTPLMTSIFHDQRWEYAFTIKRQGVAERSYKLTVFFGDEDRGLERVEGAQDMPTEEGFVAGLVRPKTNLKAPPLQASPEQLEKFAVANKNSKTNSNSNSNSNDSSDSDVGNQNRQSEPLNPTYPPLER